MESLSTEQKQAYEAVIKGESIFLTGPGGTGKSHLIGLIADYLRARGVIFSITAMTGCAALLVGNGAKTLHSWAGIGLGKGTIESHAASISKMYPVKKRWMKTEVLIIDEISMMTPDLLELLDGIAKSLRRNQKPMGGIQVVFVGDFLQLPPVAKGGNVKFAFESPVWSQVIDQMIQLKRIFRQDDPTFQGILDEARIGELSTASLAILKSRCDLSWDNEPIQPTLLFTRNADVDSINNSNLAELEGEPHTYVARTLPHGHPVADVARVVEKLDKDANYVAELVLKVGAQVMLITNLDQEKGLVNGSRGVVTGFREGLDWPIVIFKNGQQLPIEPFIWKSDHEPPIERSQIPLRLAYSLTIHKAQGATLDCSLIDIGVSTFEYGQAYVALSRAKNLEGLYIHEVSAAAFRAHPLVKKFYAGTYEPPVAPAPVPVPVPASVTTARGGAERSATAAGGQAVKRKTPPLKGKKAAYGFEEEQEPPQQSSLKNYWGIPPPK
jgi:ATP-dependent DNA helicase PIF1